jgi:hypothetical protein
MFVKLSAPVPDWFGDGVFDVILRGTGETVVLATLHFVSGSDIAEVIGSVTGTTFAEALALGALTLDVQFFGEGFFIVAAADTIDELNAQEQEPPVAYTPGDFDRNHIGLTFGGILPGSEIWVCSVKLANASDGLAGDAADLILNEMDLHAWMEASIAPAVQTYFQSDGTGISNQCWLTFAKLSRYGRNGKLRNDQPSEVYEHVYPAGTVGHSAANPHPNQVALAVSLTTDYTRGAGHRGRFYLPMPTWGVSQGLIAAGDAGSVATATKTFLEAISDVPGSDAPGTPGAAVMSRKSGAAVTRKVTGVSVGRAYDTIRRRRNKVAENYINLAVDQGAF